MFVVVTTFYTLVRILSILFWGVALIIIICPPLPKGGKARLRRARGDIHVPAREHIIWRSQHHFGGSRNIIRRRRTSLRESARCPRAGRAPTFCLAESRQRPAQGNQGSLGELSFRGDFDSPRVVHIPRAPPLGTTPPLSPSATFPPNPGESSP